MFKKLCKKLMDMALSAFLWLSSVKGLTLPLSEITNLFLSPRVSFMQDRLSRFMAENGLVSAVKFSKGWSSEVYLTEDIKGKKFALKLEKGKSPRRDMARKEAENLRFANSLGIGPELVCSDSKSGAILMEYIEGTTFGNWLLDERPSAAMLSAFLRLLMRQAEKMDNAGLSHGQLAGRGKNILVRRMGCNCEPVIIDFEKASRSRKCNNARQLSSFLFCNPNSVIAKTVKETLGETVPD
jgi:predicted Ser/Thr protein kinase